jgi:hypothetical protein
VITRDKADRRAQEILGYPPDHPYRGWGLDVFSHGWIIRWRLANLVSGCIVIERDTGTVRYFNDTEPRLVIANYEAVRRNGTEQPDSFWSPWLDKG